MPPSPPKMGKQRGRVTLYPKLTEGRSVCISETVDYLAWHAGIQQIPIGRLLYVKHCASPLASRDADPLTGLWNNSNIVKAPKGPGEIKLYLVSHAARCNLCLASAGFPDHTHPHPRIHSLKTQVVQSNEPNSCS